MATYRYFAGDLLPDSNGVRKLRAMLPLSDVRWSVARNDPGLTTATIDLRSPKATRRILDPGRTAVFVERAGQIKWGGILVDAHPSDNYTARLHILGFHSWLLGFSGPQYGRFIVHDKLYDGVGQMDIARDLVDYAQNETLHGVGANLGIGVPTGPAGLVRDRTVWRAWAKKNIGEALVDLGNVIDGITFRFHHYWTGTGADRHIATDFLVTEGVGRRLPHVFALGRNIRDISLSIEGSRFARRAHMIGDGSEADQLQQTVSKTVPGSPLFETVNTEHSTVNQADTLVDHGQDLLARRARTLVLPSITVKPGPDPQLSSYLPGEEVRVVAKLKGAPADGLLEVDGFYRLAAYTVDVGDVDANHEADEDVTIELMEP